MTSPGRRPDVPTYEDLQRSRPDLFSNEDVAIRIVLDPARRAEVEAAQARLLESRGSPREWATTGIVFMDQYMTLLRDAVEFPDGTTGTYIRSVSWEAGPPGAVVLPVSVKGIVLHEHFRHATRRWHWEIPRGFGEPGETGERAAARELEEELGVTATDFISLGTVHPDAGMAEDGVSLFLARIEGEPQLDQAEGVRALRFVTPDELERLIAEDVVTDGFTIAAFARARAKTLL